MKEPQLRIETPRMIARCWEPRDAALYGEAIDASREDLGRWTPWVIPDAEVPDAMERRVTDLRDKFLAGEQYVYGLFDTAETRVLGGAGLFPRVGPDALEIGYWTRSDEARRGYAREAARALTMVAFAHCGVARVEIRCEPGNTASSAIPRRLGFRLREVIQEPARVAGRGPVDLMVFELLATESMVPEEAPGVGVRT